MPIKQLQLRGITRTPSDEKWVSIPGFGGRYSISDKGRVRSNIAYNGRGKIMETPLRSVNNGYKRVSLCSDTGRKTYNVHRLVATAFLGDIPNDMQINHINGVKTDNRIENLEIVTPSENMKHAYKIGLEKPSDNGLKKKIIVFDSDGREQSFQSIRESCRVLGLDRRSVLRVLRGEWKQYKGYTFAV